MFLLLVCTLLYVKLHVCELRMYMYIIPMITWFRHGNVKLLLSSHPHEVMVMAKIRTHYLNLYTVVFRTELSSRRLFCSNKALMTTKRNSLVVFIEKHLHPWMNCCGINYFKRIGIIRIGRTICNFATRPASYLAIVVDAH